MNPDNFQKIKIVVDEFFKKTGFDIEAEILKPEEKTIPIKLKIEEPKTLIGQNGQTLFDIQRLLRIIISKKIPEPFYIDLDLNDYKKKKIAYLKETIRDVADEVSLTKKEKILEPMSSYERRVIHLELAGRKDVATSSIGQGPERRVVISPCL